MIFEVLKIVLGYILFVMGVSTGVVLGLAFIVRILGGEN